MFNFWQYIDYYCAWHGAAVAGTPLNIWDGYNEEQYGGDGWKLGRNFEFGSINMPNPAYTNAAHKNGVLSMGCVYFDPNNRPGQPLTPLLEQDENGSFIIAEKLLNTQTGMASTATSSIRKKPFPQTRFRFTRNLFSSAVRAVSTARCTTR